MPEPYCHGTQINAFVDANHASNQTTWHSHTGILIYGNRSTMIW
jgi:hypothetical protein